MSEEARRRLTRSILAHADRAQVPRASWPRNTFTRDGIVACALDIAGHSNRAARRECNAIVDVAGAGNQLTIATLRALLERLQANAVPRAQWDYIDKRVHGALQAK
eukprot:15483251-Alexandrium_andersonii.AAC.1